MQFPPLMAVGQLVLLALLWFPAAGAAQPDFLPPDEAFRLSVSQGGGDRVALTWEIAPDYYLYRHAFAVEGVDATVGELAYPDGERITDEYFGEQEVYFKRVTVQVDPAEAEKLALTWQGCAKAGLCYPPQETTVAVPQGAGGTGSGGAGESRGGAAKNAGAAVTGATAADATASASAALGEDQRLASQLSQWSGAWVVAAFFGMGLLLTFTPCVLPMLPILSSLVVGANAGPRRSFVLSLVYVLPMALTYAVLGVAAGLAGANLQATLQSPWVLWPFALIFVVLALAMFGAFELQLSSAIRNRLDSAQRARKRGTLGGAAAMGVLSALLVGPCMTAPLAGALLYIADTGDAVMGGMALLALGLGMGAPLLVVGTFGARLLPKPGAWMNRVKAVFGFVLLGMAIWFVDRVLADSVTLALWGVWLLAVAVALWQAVHDTLAGSRILLTTTRVAALAAGVWAAALIFGAAAGAGDPWQPLAGLRTAGSGAAETGASDFMSNFEPVASQRDLEAKIAQAGKRGQWTIVDYYAEWCVSCKVIEEEVFGDPAVQQALGSMRLLRPDVTDNDPADQRLMAAHGILGPPTIMIVGPDGEERRAQRIIGELSAAAFLERLESARENG